MRINQTLSFLLVSYLNDVQRALMVVVVAVMEGKKEERKKISNGLVKWKLNERREEH